MPEIAADDVWERVLSSASRLQGIVPGSVLVGGTAASIHAGHRLSTDADHVVSDLRDRFDEVLSQLESVAGWKTARVQRPVQILGNLDGINTGIRQLIREQPLETTETVVEGRRIKVPTEAEILRIKAVLILKRNATRDYVDFVALASHLGDTGVMGAMQTFDTLYPQPNGESPIQQLMTQLADAKPYDLEANEMASFRHLELRWQSWESVQHAASHIAVVLGGIEEEAIDDPGSADHSP